MQQKILALLPGAGIGTRVGGVIPKQYLTIGNKSIAQYTVEKLLSHQKIDKLLIATATGDSYWQNHKQITTVAGGKERVDSVINLLNQAQTMVGSDAWVLVHDLVRPCVDLLDLDKLFIAIEQIETTSTNLFDGAILGHKAIDSLKQVDENCIIKCPVNRDFIMHALTPQAFRVGALLKAIKLATSELIDITDEASAASFAGGNVVVVESNPNNIKFTKMQQLYLLEKLLT